MTKYCYYTTQGEILCKNVKENFDDTNKKQEEPLCGPLNNYKQCKAGQCCNNTGKCGGIHLQQDNNYCNIPLTYYKGSFGGLYDGKLLHNQLP